MKTHVSMALFLVLAGLLVAPALASGDEEMVLVSRPGTVFHKAGSTDLRGHAYEKTLTQALATGYAPCPVCFAKTPASLAAGSLATTGAAASAFGRSVAIPPGLRNSTLVVQPFGLRQGALHEPGLNRDGIRNPFETVRTITDPPKEQGAYGSTEAKGSYQD